MRPQAGSQGLWSPSWQARRDRLLSSLRESVGRNHRSKDDEQIESKDASLIHPSKLMGGRGASQNLRNLSNLITSSYLLNQLKYQKITVMVLAITLTLPAIKAYAREQVEPREWKCLEQLWHKESRWNYRAISATQDYGIPQRHMRKNTAKQRTAFLSDPLAQIDWGLAYIQHRYSGSPCKAWNHSQRKGWY